jgi:hypothetical protein
MKFEFLTLFSNCFILFKFKYKLTNNILKNNMGTAPSTPVAIVKEDPTTGKTVYDGSIYTGYSSTSMMVQDFPWVILLDKNA